MNQFPVLNKIRKLLLKISIEFNSLQSISKNSVIPLTYIYEFSEAQTFTEMYIWECFFCRLEMVQENYLKSYATVETFS